MKDVMFVTIKKLAFKDVAYKYFKDAANMDDPLGPVGCYRNVPVSSFLLAIGFLAD